MNGIEQRLETTQEGVEQAQDLRDAYEELYELQENNGTEIQKREKVGDDFNERKKKSPLLGALDYIRTGRNGMYSIGLENQMYPENALQILTLSPKDGVPTRIEGCNFFNTCIFQKYANGYMNIIHSGDEGVFPDFDKFRDYKQPHQFDNLKAGYTSAIYLDGGVTIYSGIYITKEDRYVGQYSHIIKLYSDNKEDLARVIKKLDAAAQKHAEIEKKVEEMGFRIDYEG